MSYLCRVLRLHGRCRGCSCPCHNVPEPVDAPAYTAAAPGSGTIRMPKVNLPEGYEPPSAAVLSVADRGGCDEEAYQHLLASWGDLVRTVNSALRELGVPNEHYPAPVANAVEILRQALLDEHGGPSEVQFDPEGLDHLT